MDKYVYKFTYVHNLEMFKKVYAFPAVDKCHKITMTCYASPKFDMEVHTEFQKG